MDQIIWDLLVNPAVIWGMVAAFGLCIEAFVTTLFEYPDEIRKVIYTTNAIESPNSVIRKAIKNRKVFPND